MNARRPKLLARGLPALAAALLMGGFVAAAAAGRFELGGTNLFTTAITFAFAAVGALIAARHPANAIGWIFIGVAVTTGFGALTHGYVDYRLAHGDMSTAVRTAAVYSDLSWIPFVLVPTTFLILLFPDGQLPSRRWRPVAWAAGVGIAAQFVTGSLVPGPFADYPELRNPYGIESALLELLGALSLLVVAGGVIGSAASLVVRFRHGRHEQRQQIKWLAVAGALAAVTLVIVMPFYDVFGEDAANGLMMFAVLGLPAAAGIAILRHRLYDIDVVINRALVYGALTATLASTYLAIVLLLQLVLSAVTADSGLAIAGSTLAVAAVFQPARRRIQAMVDRRFYRRRYDAARTLEQFAARLRVEVDLDALGGQLRAVVGETMQPAHVSLWLREPERVP